MEPCKPWWSLTMEGTYNCSNQQTFCYLPTYIGKFDIVKVVIILPFVIILPTYIGKFDIVKVVIILI
jgi:hypothetical protein